MEFKRIFIFAFWTGLSAFIGFFVFWFIPDTVAYPSTSFDRIPDLLRQVGKVSFVFFLFGIVIGVVRIFVHSIEDEVEKRVTEKKRSLQEEYRKKISELKEWEKGLKEKEKEMKAKEGDVEELLFRNRLEGGNPTSQ